MDGKRGHSSRHRGTGALLASTLYARAVRKTVLRYVRTFSHRVLESESEYHQTSFMLEAANTNQDGAMLPMKNHVLPSRKDDRVILHFDCRYIDLHGTTCKMQLADTAFQR
jgi:hypothetical protein